MEPLEICGRLRSSLQSLLTGETIKQEPNLLGIYQNLTKLGEMKCPSPALSSPIVFHVR